MGKTYDRVRPSYPLEAIRWAVGQEPAVAVDLGCGSGKLTLGLEELGHRVVGIDPSVRMLEWLRGAGVTTVCGTAEAIPLVDGCADVVTAGQAFHWFDPSSALAEVQRVLRPGGRLGLLWNLRDERVDWVRELSDLIGSEDAMVTTLVEPGSFEARVQEMLLRSQAFDAVEVHAFPWNQEMDEEHLVGLVASRSYVAILPADERERLLARVARLCRTHPELRSRARFALPYRTLTIRARVRN